MEGWGEVPMVEVLEVEAMLAGVEMAQQGFLVLAEALPGRHNRERRSTNWTTPTQRNPQHSLS